MNKTVFSLALLGAVTAPGGAAWAEEAEPTWTFPGSVTVVSDYIFRGQTQTWGEMAAQVSLEANHASGFYVGFFGSNVSDQWLPGATLETDLYAGFRGNLGADEQIAYDVGVVYYMYPGADWDKSGFNPPAFPEGTTESGKLDSGEIYVAVTYAFATFKTGYMFTDYFGWNTNNSGIGIGFAGDLEAGVKDDDTDGSYFYELNLAYEVAPSWTLSGQVGQQVIAESEGLDIVYYKVGVTKALPESFSLGLFWSGTDEPDAYEDFLSLRDTIDEIDVAQGTFVASLTKTF